MEKNKLYKIRLLFSNYEFYLEKKLAQEKEIYMCHMCQIYVTCVPYVSHICHICGLCMKHKWFWITYKIVFLFFLTCTHICCIICCHMCFHKCCHICYIYVRHMFRKWYVSQIWAHMCHINGSIYDT